MATDNMLDALAANVRREMKARGWTQTELAKRCGWPPARITEVLQGKFDPRLGTVEKIAAAFGIPAPVLLMTPLAAGDEDSL